MFIVWGTKVVKTYQGRRAEYCPLCRDVRPMRRTRLSTVGHLYYIPLGWKKPVGVLESCETYTLSREASFDDDAPLARPRRLDLDTLIHETNPDVRRRHAETLNLPERLRSRRAEPTERERATLDTLLLANILLDGRTGSIQIDRLAGLALLAMFASPIVMMGVVPRLISAPPELVVNAGLDAGGIFLVLAIILMARDGRRYAHRVLLPIIARSLAPLDPPVEEIESALDSLRANKMKLGKYLKASTVREMLDQVETRHG